MANIEDVNAKLDYIGVTKQLIKQAIENKGQDIEDTDTFREFVDKISNIRTKSNFTIYGITGHEGTRVGDTYVFVLPTGQYKLGDYAYQYISKEKITSSGIKPYHYKVGIIEVTNIEPAENDKERVTFTTINIHSYSFPKFISNTVEETGIKYGNFATDNIEYNWYSYDYSNLDVQSQDVLVTKRFQGPTGIEVGSMPNNGELNYSPTNNAQTIPAGYTSGGVISAMDITTSNDYNRCLVLSKEILGIE